MDELGQTAGDVALMDRELLTVEQAAEYLQVHPETIRKWLREGRLTGASLGGRARWRVRRADLDRFVQSKQGADDHLVIREDSDLATYAGLVESVRDAMTDEQKRTLWARLVGFYRRHPATGDLVARTPAETAFAFLDAAVELLQEEQQPSWRSFLETVQREADDKK